jgi:aminoglycoside phosphotransferase (APT) family kinase protein
MKHLIAVAEALTRVPGWDDGDSTWREIAGGRTNRSYLVSTKDGRFVLRLDGEPAEPLGLDRATELLIQRRAAEAGLAAAVVYADPDAGVLISEYLPGPVWTRRSLDDNRNLEVLAEVLRAVHALPASGTRFDAPAIARRYAAVLGREAAHGPEVARCVHDAEAAPPADEYACCHNDVVASNIIGAGLPRLLDWEYACDNEPYFDLASTIGYHDLDRGRADALLAAYTGASPAEHRERLEAQLRRYKALEYLWFAVVDAFRRP